jgi:hypothetical protein
MVNKPRADHAHRVGGQQSGPVGNRTFKNRYRALHGRWTPGRALLAKMNPTGWGGSYGVPGNPEPTSPGCKLRAIRYNSLFWLT